MGIELSLNGKVVIVTGAGGGLGKTLALGFAEAGADVVVAGFYKEPLIEVSSAIEDMGRTPLAIEVDMKRLDMVEKMVDRTVQQFGRIDALCHITELGERKPIMELTREEWRTGIDFYLKSYHLCSTSVAKVMAGKKQGRIINVISMFGAPGAFEGLSIYGTAMAGVVMLTKVQAVEWAPYNIYVNAIAPGWLSKGAMVSVLKDEDLKEKLTQRVPLQRIAHPEEITPLAVFLASETCTYISGTIIYADGGMTALNSGALVM